MIFTARSDGRFELGEAETRCALGRNGVVAAEDKREGDGASPAGVWPIREVLYRPDRGPAPVTRLPCRPLRRADGWCDAPADRNYNRPVALPYRAGAEALWRDDGLYDLVAVLGYNDDPPVPHRGSAIFLHVWAGGRPTEGCVALAKADLQQVLRLAGPQSAVAIAAVNDMPDVAGILAGSRRAPIRRPAARLAKAR
jgi:L,D-peptidoglycan transpeptidase YkuD (ErfK/YbiS/YcfS/YnhG family)